LARGVLVGFISHGAAPFGEGAQPRQPSTTDWSSSTRRGQSYSAIGVLLNSGNPAISPVTKALEPAAYALHVKLQYVEIASGDGLVPAFATMAQRLVDARRITDRALQHRLPALGVCKYKEAGGPIAHGVGFPDETSP
jgi:hypothetical protein